MNSNNYQPSSRMGRAFCNPPFDRILPNSNITNEAFSVYSGHSLRSYTHSTFQYSVHRGELFWSIDTTRLSVLQGYRQYPLEKPMVVFTPPARRILYCSSDTLDWGSNTLVRSPRQGVYSVKTVLETWILREKLIEEYLHVAFRKKRTSPTYKYHSFKQTKLKKKWQSDFDQHTDCLVHCSHVYVGILSRY